MKKNCFVICSILVTIILFGCSESNQNHFQGYIEGEFIYLASPKSGRLDSLLVERGKTIEANTLLFELDDEYEHHVLQKAEQELIAASALLRDMQTGKRAEEIAMAEAQLTQAEAEATNAKALLHRNQVLIKSGGLSQQELDNSRADANASEARVVELTQQIAVFNLPERNDKIAAQQATVKAAEATVAQAKWELAQKQVHSPNKGLVYDTLFRQGEWVAAGSPVIQMLPPNNVKIRFFVPEMLIGNIQLGDQIQVMADGRNELFLAKISYIATNAEYTPPVIYSNETRSKLVFMIEAHPELDIAPFLHPGQPVNVSISND